MLCVLFVFWWRFRDHLLDCTQVLGFAGRLAGLCDGWFVVICLHFRAFSVLVQMAFSLLMLM